MEQARCWMAKQAQKFVDESWEERAFAEDAAGMLGGCVWPPRSYTCSFCGRDFRSAQALGGHMNVHRRDRAKLKQLACSQNNQILNPHGIDCYNNNNLFHSYSSLTFSYSTSHQNQDCCSFICNNPNPDSNQPVLSQELNGSKQSLNPYFSSLVINHKRKPSLEPYNLENNSKNNDLEDCNNGNYPKKSRFSLSLDLEIKCPTQVACYDEDDLNNCKRRKVDVPSQPGMSKPSGEDKVDNSLSKVDTLNSNSIEELDLELRLGVLPKVQ